MKTTFSILILNILLSFVLTAQTKQISMGGGYIYQSFYSMANGEILNSLNNDWDIAFTTDTYSSTIRINGGGVYGQGVELYTYHLGDTSNWSSINTSTPNILTSPMHNSDTSWNYGAFGMNQTNGMLDYGWGVYNTVTHHIVGDSLYVIKTINGNWKKLWIKKKASGSYEFTYANLDGSNIISTTVSASNYSNKRFVYYSLDQDQIIDREPDLSSWDITFTRYITTVQGMPYPVTGILSNIGIKIADADNIPSPSNYTDYNNHTFNQEINTIGDDWKTFDMSSFTYTLDNERCFFIKDYNEDVWRLIFTKFDGSSTGNIEFNIQNLSTTAINNIQDSENSLNIYPNPVNNQDITIIYDIKNDKAKLNIYDLSGREVYASKLVGNGFNTHKISGNHLEKGVYIVSLISNNNILTDRLIIK